MANVVGTVGAGLKDFPHNYSFSHLTSSPTLPNLDLTYGDYGRVYFEASQNFSPHHLHALPDHVGGDLQQPFSFPSSFSPDALLSCNKIVTLQQKSDKIIVTKFTYLIYKGYESVTKL